MSLLKIQGKTKVEGNAKFGSRLFISDSDVLNYITAIQTADGQDLEQSVILAYNDFIVGCKTDGIWSALKASCIMAGARTLNGALVPLVGVAPTNINFVSADYNRKDGLLSDGLTKYLNTNRNNNADPQNSNHNAVYATTVVNAAFMGQLTVNTSVSGSNQLGILNIRSRSSTSVTNTYPINNCLIGSSRSSSSNFVLRSSKSQSTVSNVSQVPSNTNLTVFGNIVTSNYGTHRLSFYSIGEAIDLNKLETRLTTLMTTISSAI
jgi:hypothetical protein